MSSLIKKFSTHEFHGGIHPPEYKSVSNNEPIRILNPPDTIVFAIDQQAGQAGEILVSVGQKVSKGELIVAARPGISANCHSPISGEVKAIEHAVLAHPSGKETLHITIERVNHEEKLCYLTSIQNWQDQEPQILLDRIHDAGIVGLGGAAFPTHIKHLANNIDTIIINAAECEPFITCDDLLLRENAKQTLEGMAILSKINGAKNCLIGIEDNKPEAIEALENILANETFPIKNVELIVVPTKYPSGGEKQLIELLTGKQVPHGKLPSDLGLVVQNVATCFAVYEAVTTGKPLIERLVTITGESVNEIANGKICGNYWLPIGTPLKQVINELGIQNENLDHIIMGGPMMGFELPSQNISVIKSSNCFIFAAKNELRTNARELQCIRCGECTKVCPATLIPQQLYWFTKAEEWEKAEDYNLMDCIECGACSYVCPSQIPLVHYYRFGKSQLKKRNEEKQKSLIAKQRHEFKEFRVQRDKAEKAEKHKKAAEARKQKAQAAGQQDDKQAAIQAALQRAKEKKQAQQESEQ